VTRAQAARPVKPLFVPLKGAYFFQFENGTKPNMEEYRPYGPRWNERTCWVGRPVTLRYGYRGRSLRAVIVGFRVSEEPTQTQAWADCYGSRFPGVPAACIKVALIGADQVSGGSDASEP
jgi:hypothetical protein